MATLKGGRRSIPSALSRTMQEAEYEYPADWPWVLSPASGTIELLVADLGAATFALQCTTSSGQYTVNWGDSSSGNFDSGVTAQHTYTPDTGTSCSRGYTTFKITISGSLLTFKLVRHNLWIAGQHFFVLACGFNSATITTLASAFYTTNEVQCRHIEAVSFFSLPACTSISNFVASGAIYNGLKFVNYYGLGAVTTAQSSFGGCIKLRAVDLTPLHAVTDMAALHHRCYSLHTVKTTNFTTLTAASNLFTDGGLITKVNPAHFSAVTDATDMFFGSGLHVFDLTKMPNLVLTSFMFCECSNLAQLDFSQLGSVTSAEGMCDEMILLDTANINAMVNVSSADAMFAYTALKSLTSNLFASSAGSCSALDMFSYIPGGITSVNLSGAKLTGLGIVGSENTITAFSFHASSTFSDELDLRYNPMSEAQFETIVASLPSGEVRDIAWSDMINVPVYTFSGVGHTAASPTLTIDDTGNLDTGMFCFCLTGVVLNAPACTFQDSGDTVTITSHGFDDNDLVAFASITTTTGISIFTPYYVKSATANTFQVSLTQGGAAITLTSDGTGQALHVPTITAIDPDVSVTLSSNAFLTGTQEFNFCTMNYAAMLTKGWS